MSRTAASTLVATVAFIVGSATRRRPRAGGRPQSRPRRRGTPVLGLPRIQRVGPSGASVRRPEQSRYPRRAATSGARGAPHAFSAGRHAAIVAFPRLRPGFRAGIALVFAVLAIVNGTLHLIHVTDGGPSGSDVTGVLALAAGVVLAVLGLAMLFVHRGEGGRTRTRRWVNRAVFAIAGAVVLYGFVFPTSLAMIETNKYREPIGSPPSAEYEPVSSPGSVRVASRRENKFCSRSGVERPMPRSFRVSQTAAALSSAPAVT